MADSIGVVVVGAGQAGLAVSHELGVLGVDHVVLERGRVAQGWRNRWDGFYLNTPNEFITLPGGAYEGPDPQGFLSRDSIVGHLERYAARFRAPVREEVAVSRLSQHPKARFQLSTSAGEIEASAVVLATGAFQKAHLPTAATAFPKWLPVFVPDDYRRPDSLPPGRVLVIGSGQTGVQLAEELHRAGREVVVACGRAPWVPRRIDGRDSVSWLMETPFLEQRLADLPNPMQARLVANVQASGNDGGHDLNFRVLQEMGVRLAGRLAGVDGERAYFADDLADSVAFGDARYAEICELFRRSCAERGIKEPHLPVPPPFSASPPESVRLREFGSVLVTSGFRPDYGSWVHIDGAFDEQGFPIAPEGASTATPGLYFVGVHYLRKRKSSLLYGVGEDAAIVAAQVAG